MSSRGPAARRFVGSVLVALFVTTAPAAEIYRHVAPDGTVVYSDRPPSQPADVVKTEPARPISAEERARESARLRALEALSRERLEKDDAIRRAAAAPDPARCRKAREENAYFQHDAAARRLEKDDPRPFYTAAEITQRREAAKREMAAYCPR